ncbi:hypothetical protein J3R83DRAFT_10413 [Lanmaoa asiatica]|nr:hypothetical protein J3R83DRAFT_10413 [Lanmaoa asiatica]
MIYAVLGGPEAGITHKRPFIASGKNIPPFPLVVTCHSEAAATDVMLLQPLVLELNGDESLRSVARKITSSSICINLFNEHEKFYTVVLGKNIGIYFTWLEVCAQVHGRTIRKFIKSASFSDALTYMITKGKIRSVSHPARNKNSPHMAEPTDVQLSPLSVSLALVSRDNSGSTDVSRTFSVLSISHSQPSHHNALSVQSLSPRPLSHPSTNSEELSPVHPPQPTHTTNVSEGGVPPSVFRFVRTLSGVIGSTTSASDPIPDVAEDFPPAGILRIYAERYLLTHGYRVAAWWHIVHAYKDASNMEEFAGYLCARGMAQAEVEYLHDLISWSGLGLEPDDPRSD